MTIYKATLVVTLLMQGDDYNDSKALIESMDLLAIASEMDDGEFVGTHEIAFFDVVPAAHVASELATIGCDNTFFEVLDLEAEDEEDEEGKET